MRAAMDDEKMSTTRSFQDAGSQLETRQRGGYAPSIVAASSAAGSAAGRSHVTQASRVTATATLVTASEQPDRRGVVHRKLAAVGSYLYDSGSGRILNRTPADFFALLLFYFIFYSLLAGVFAICWIFFSYIVIDEDVPLRTGRHSTMRLSPGIGIRPMPDFLGTTIRFRQSRPESYLFYTTNMQAYLDQYELFYNTERDVNIVDCDIRTNHRGSRDPIDSCRYELDWLGPCNKQAFFGYPRGIPCVLLKLNRVFGWLPDIIDPNTSRNVLVRCHGRFPADKDNMGELRYYPSENVNGTEYGIISPLFFPYLTQVGYRSPLVGVQFVSPRRNVVIMVECLTYNVRNIEVDRVYRIGSLTFELMID